MSFYLTPSHLLEYLYCPRFTYYEYVLGIPQREEKHYKVLKGREIHELRQKINRNYLRNKLKVKKKELVVELNCNDLHLRGMVDELLYLDDDTMAPFDFKYAEYKEHLWETYKIQTLLYAVMIKKIYGVEVNKGFICFVRSEYKVIELELKEEGLKKALEYVDDCVSVIQKEIYPQATKSKVRCLDCTYQNICIK